MNPTLDVLNARFSVRVYDQTPLTDAEKQSILHSTMRAPTGGNMMLYSIIEVTDQALKDRLAVTCDNQPFIATAPWVLVFLADWQRTMDCFAAAGAVARPRGGAVARPRGGAVARPREGDLLLACCDALIAAQTLAAAAEARGLGSCY